jgi:hypothetical protein
MHCPAFEPQRRKLRAATGRDANSIRKIFTTQKHLPALFQFVDETGRLAQTFPHIPLLELPSEDTR